MVSATIRHVLIRIKLVSSINFDHHFCFMAIEIHQEVTDRVLPAKLHPGHFFFLMRDQSIRSAGVILFLFSLARAKISFCVL